MTVCTTSKGTKKIHIRTTGWSYTHSRMPKMKRWERPSEHQIFEAVATDRRISATALKICLQYLFKLNTHIPYSPIAPLLGIFPTEISIHLHWATCTRLFIAAIVNNLKLRSTQIPTNSWLINISVYLMMENTRPMKVNNLQLHLMIWMNFTNIALNERSQTQKYTQSMIPLTQSTDRWNCYMPYSLGRCEEEVECPEDRSASRSPRLPLSRVRPKQYTCDKIQVVFQVNAEAEVHDEQRPAQRHTWCCFQGRGGHWAAPPSTDPLWPWLPGKFFFYSSIYVPIKA